MTRYYIYVHRRLDTNEVFYIGRGKVYSNEISRKYKNSKIPYRRAYAKDNRNKEWLKVITVANYDIIILFDELKFKRACQLETELIKFHGRKDLGLGTLTNMTDGGEDETNRVYKLSTKVRSYDNDGQFLIQFDSIKEASKHYNININVITKHCKNRTIFSRNGIRFRYDHEDLDKIEPSYTRKSKRNNYKVGKYSINMELIETYSSISEVCKKNNTTWNRIWRCCNNKEGRTKHKGFIWQYVEK